MRVNGVRVEAGTRSDARLLDLLREDLHLTGAKEGCGMGECGSCTVLLDGRAVCSCLVPAQRVADSDIVTVEGLADAGYADLQDAFVEAQALQCGYCIPGVLMSCAGLIGREPTPTRAQVGEALSGNLCRCTAYNRFHDAVGATAAGRCADHGQDPPAETDADTDAAPEVGSITTRQPSPTQARARIAQQLADGARPLGGGTDLMVAARAGRAPQREVGRFPAPREQRFADLWTLERAERSAGIPIVEQAPSGGLRLSALAPLEQLADEIRESLPGLAAAIAVFAGATIRNLATLGGNLANGSPAADTVPPLLAADAELILTTGPADGTPDGTGDATGGEPASGTRVVPIADFLLGPRLVDLRPGEWIESIHIPAASVRGPGTPLEAGLRKLAPRRAQAISVVNLAWQWVPAPGGRLTEVRLAAGAAAPTVVRLRAAESVIGSASLDAAIIAAAVEAIDADIAPIDDLRGSAVYRRRALAGLLREVLTLALRAANDPATPGDRGEQR